MLHQGGIYSFFVLRGCSAELFAPSKHSAYWYLAVIVNIDECPDDYDNHDECANCEDLVDSDCATTSDFSSTSCFSSTIDDISTGGDHHATCRDHETFIHGIPRPDHSSGDELTQTIVFGNRCLRQLISNLCKQELTSLIANIRFV